jgi:hypothetical protein
MNLEPNEREINPATIVRIDNYLGYNFIDNGGIVEFTICEYIEQYAPDGIEFTYIKIPLYSDAIDLPFSLVNQWGASDEIIFDYVIDQVISKL